MPNGNPFYVHPGADFGPGLMGLAGTISKVGEIKKKETAVQEEKDRVKSMQAAAMKVYATGNPDKIAEFALANPEISKALTGAAKFRNEQTKENYIDSIFQAIQDPSRIPEITANRQAFLQSQGVGPEESVETDSFVERYEKDKPGTLQALKAELAFIAPEKWKAYKSALEGKPLSPAGKLQSDIDKGLLTEEQAKESGATYAPVKLTKLFTKLDELKDKGSNRWKYYQKAIDLETSGGNPDLDLILAQRIVDEKLDFNKLSRRGGQKGRVAAMIAQIEPDFDLIAADANIKYKTDSANLRSIALIAGIEPLFEELSGQAAGLSNSVIPIFNKGINFWKLQTGEAKIVAFNNLRDDIIAEVERVLMGSGVLSDMKYQRALHNLNSAQSPEQMGAAIQQMMLVVQKRDEALRAQPYPQKRPAPEITLQGVLDGINAQRKGSQ